MDYRTLIGEIMAPAIRRYKEREARRAADEHALSKAMLEKPSGEKPSHEDKPAGGNDNGHSTQPVGSDAQQRLDIKA
jgi:D-alanine-D-alanine ligase